MTAVVCLGSALFSGCSLRELSPTEKKMGYCPLNSPMGGGHCIGTGPDSPCPQEFLNQL